MAVAGTLDEGDPKLLFGGEVVIERTLRNPCQLKHFGKPAPVEALLAEQLGAGGQNAVARIRFFGWVIGGHAGVGWIRPVVYRASLLQLQGRATISSGGPPQVVPMSSPPVRNMAGSRRLRVCSCYRAGPTTPWCNR